MFQGFGQAFVITLREGLEAFLIVAISLAYLRKRGRGELTKAVHWGIVSALAVSALGGYLLYNAANQEWLEGPLALVAAVSVTTLTVHMWRAGRRMKGEIEGHLRLSAERAGIGALIGVFLFTLLMVGREAWRQRLLMQLRNTRTWSWGQRRVLWPQPGRVDLVAIRSPRESRPFFQVTVIFQPSSSCSCSFKAFTRPRAGFSAASGVIHETTES
jgi:hypothetical protein